MQAHSRCTCLSDIQHGWLQTLGQLQVVHPSWAGPRCWLVTPQPPLHMLALRYRPFFAMEPGSMENLSIVYRSRDFLVVNKHWDVRIDSKTWRETLTLQKQLRHRFPELADPDTYYGFRYLCMWECSTSNSQQPPLEGSGCPQPSHC